MKRQRLVIDETGETWPPAKKRLRLEVGQVVVRPSDDVPLGLVPEIWTHHIMPQLVADDYTVRTGVMLRRTTRWLAHHVELIARHECNRCDGHSNVFCDWIRLYGMECHRFIRDGQLSALCWATNPQETPCSTGVRYAHKLAAQQILEDMGVAAFDRFRAVHKFRVGTRLVKRVVELGNARLLRWCIEQSRCLRGLKIVTLVQLAIARGNWELFAMLLAEVQRVNVIHSDGGPALLDSLRAALDRSPLAVAAVLQFQNRKLRDIKLGGHHHQQLRDPLLKLAAALNQYTV
jgi:hypothetical protein